MEHLRDPAGDDLPTDVDGELAPHVSAVEETLVDQVVVEVFLVRFRLPAFEVDVEERLRDAVRREEAVRDALREGIDVERLAVRLLAEVVEIVRSFDGLRRGGHAYLRGGREVFEDALPFRIVTDASAMAFVHDDKVEEVRRERFVGLLRLRDVDLRIGLLRGLVVFHPLAVERHVYLEGRVDVLLLNLRHDLLERLEVLRHCLVDENVAVGEVENLLLEAALVETVDYLKRGIGLAGSSRHHKKCTLRALGDRLDSAVDGDALIVAWRIGLHVVVVRRVHHGAFGWVEAAAVPIAPVQLGGSGEAVKGDVGALVARRAVELEEAVAVRAEGERKVEDFGVVDRLLDAAGNGLVVVLRLNDGDGEVRLGEEDVVGLVAVLLRVTLALCRHEDSTGGKVLLHQDQIVFPPGFVQGGSDKPILDILLGHVLLADVRL